MEEITRRLTPLKDFPGYYIDMETHEVWSYMKHCTKKKPEWFKKKVRQGKHPSVQLKKGDKSTNVILAKLVLSVQSGKSYYEIPSDTFIFHYNQDRSIKIESRSEQMVKWWEKRRKETNDNRVEETEHHIHCLELLLKAYKGDARPLLRYVTKRRQDYLRILTSEGYGYEKAKVAYEATFDRLIQNLQYTTCKPYNFDGWFIKSMRGEIKQLYRKYSREVNPEHLPYFK